MDINTTSGSFGILPMHVPAVAVLKPGVVTVYEGDKTQKFFGTYRFVAKTGKVLMAATCTMCTSPFSSRSVASSGAVTINADSSVQILAEEAFPIDRLDAQVGVIYSVNPN